MRNLFLSISLLFALLFESRMASVTALGNVRTFPDESLPVKDIAAASSDLTVNLSTATGKTIFFKREDGEEEAKPVLSGTNLPHLVLKRNGVPTPSFERTLIVSVDNLPIALAGVYVQLTIETQHTDPDLGRRNKQRIRVRQETIFVPYDALIKQGGKMQFRITFQPATKLADKTIKMPADYYRFRIVISDSQHNKLKSYSGDYAFLIENQWRVPLPPVSEQTPGAAPTQLLIYYYDMVPFQKDLRDPDTQIPRQEVDRYIQTELIPAMVKAFEIQTDLWDLPWYQEWSSYRREDDPKTLSVALDGYHTWFHGSAPSLGYAMISIRVDGSFGAYSNLTEGIMSVFHHELFHNQQRNISLHFGSNGNIAGQDEVWQLFSEGTAVLASSVGQPKVEFEAKAYWRSYLQRANSFIGSEDAIGGGLNQKYKDIPYHTAVYWRFLYEHCGGIGPDGEDPAAGMKVIRHALETLYKGEIVQVNTSTDVASAFPHIMDRALGSTPSCAFHTYEESLIHFARAIYMLRLEDGRCPSPIEQSYCGLINSHHLYQTPPADTFVLAANPSLEVSGAIPSSYGIDLINVEISQSLRGKKLKFLFTSPANSGLEFHVEAWKTRTINKNGEPEQQSVPKAEPISGQTENGNLTLEFQNLSKNDFDSLGLIITRIDPYEDRETTGAYSIQLSAE
ncbi:MAG TPA: hypothetical protein VK206_15480 [Anaerolineales bacterium]|nr:hypothetical protein [Anaerolineales bacterium]